MKYNNNLKELRKQRMLTQQEIANVIDMTQKNYSAMENGHIKIKKEYLAKLANFFNVSVEKILGLPEAKQNTAFITIDETQLLIDYRGLTEAQKERVRGYINCYVIENRENGINVQNKNTNA